MLLSIAPCFACTSTCSRQLCAKTARCICDYRVFTSECSDCNVPNECPSSSVVAKLIALLHGSDVLTACCKTFWYIVPTLVPGCGKKWQDVVAALIRTVRCIIRKNCRYL